eukprot:scaffold86386_cov75-Phaeocystis_antarctica.AAC.3
MPPSAARRSAATEASGSLVRSRPAASNAARASSSPPAARSDCAARSHSARRATAAIAIRWSHAQMASSTR